MVTVGATQLIPLYHFQKVKKEASVECYGNLLSILAQGLNYIVLS